jgi:enediyne biosynthesis protein E4
MITKNRVPRLLGSVLACSVVVALCGLNDTAQAVVYTNVTAAAGITHVQNQGPGVAQLVMTGGAAAGDFDNDGWVDIFVTRLDAPDILYRNKGDGTFENVSTAAGFTANLPTNGPAWGDVDNDGDLDLYVTAAGDGSTAGADRFYMYINDGNGGFTEQAVSRGADIGGVSRYGQSVTFGDYDGDGYLDIFTNDWGNETSVSTSRLLRNLGAANPGYYEDVTAAAGVDVYRPSQFFPTGTNTQAYRFSSTFSDMDRDGRPDLVIAGDFETSQIFWNNGDGTFTDGTLAAGVGTGQDAMGLTIGDYDGDGLLDMFVSNLVNVPGETVDHSGNRLFRNNGDRTFTDQTDAGGVRDSGWSWGTTFLDHDNDGDLDLAVTNGWPFQNDQSHLYQNDNGVFTDISTAAGITDNDQGRGLFSFDYDNDGDLDIFITNNGTQPILYRNDGGNDNDWLRIKVQGTVSNRDGIGTFITVDPDTNVLGDEMVREIGAGSNFLSQNEFAAHFGLGLNAGIIDLVTIVWPSGTVQELSNVSANQLLNLVEIILGDLDGNGFVGVDDLNIVLGAWNQNVTPGDLLAGDATGDGFVGIDDLNAVLMNWNVGTPPAELAVPEPGSLTVLTLCGLVLLRHRVRSGQATSAVCQGEAELQY